MNVTLRAPAEDDWPDILRVANEALPDAEDANAAWLAARRGFDGAALRRRNYVACGPDGRIVGYAGIEQTPGKDSYRVFVVASPERLTSGSGDQMYDALRRDLEELGASSAWMREEARDLPTIDFALRHGFTERERFTFDGIEIAVLALDLSR